MNILKYAHTYIFLNIHIYTFCGRCGLYCVTQNVSCFVRSPAAASNSP